MNPKKWTQVYPQGTKEGDEEQLFFIGKDGASGLARHFKYDWRSTASIVSESGLSPVRVEAIIQKYVKLGLIYASRSRDDHWGYWERVPDRVPKDPTSIARADQDDRIDSVIGLDSRWSN